MPLNFHVISSVRGSRPQSGDRVLVEATYNANMPFKWNATRIQVLPSQVNKFYYLYFYLVIIKCL